MIAEVEKSLQTLDFLILEAPCGNDLTTEFHYSQEKSYLISNEVR